MARSQLSSTWFWIWCCYYLLQSTVVDFASHLKKNGLIYLPWTHRPWENLQLQGESPKPRPFLGLKVEIYVWQDAIVTCKDDDIFWDSPRYMGSALIGHCAYQFPIIFIRLISMKVVSNLIPAWFCGSNGHDLSPRQYVSAVLLVPRLLVSESKEKVTKNLVGKGSWNILD